MGGQWKCFMNTYKIGKDGKTNVLNQKKKILSCSQPLTFLVC